MAVDADGGDDSARRTARWLVFAGLSLAVATMLGAFGTHALKPRLPPARFESFETGVFYQFFHTLGLFAILWLRARRDSAALRWSARLIVVGIALFCGSIYALALGAPRALGMIAPLGGASFMLAWLLFAFSTWRDGISPERR